jgi:phytanoyl-CoA hydroxylase
MAELQSELRSVRERAGALLNELAARGAELDASGTQRTSWVDGRVRYDPRAADARRAAFDRDGFLVVRRFADAETVGAMRREMAELTEAWDPSTALVPFRTDGGQDSAQARSDYFLESASRVHFFAEPGAVDEATSRLCVPKHLALNKAGHGLHVGDSPFGAYARSDALSELVHALGWQCPVLPQSMYIFKQPKVGGEVTSHQDSSFLHTEPRQTCLGLWLALDDATLQNGCLWVRPGSHREPLRRRFSRNRKHFGDAATGVAPDPSEPQMVFEQLPPPEGLEHGAGSAWEGSLPEGSWPLPCEGLFANGFVPVEVRAGDLVCFPGTLDHLSLANRSADARHTFQLHLVEGPAAGVRWTASNWLQYPAGQAFPVVPPPPAAHGAGHPAAGGE